MILLPITDHITLRINPKLLPIIIASVYWEDHHAAKYRHDYTKGTQSLRQLSFNLLRPTPQKRPKQSIMDLIKPEARLPRRSDDEHLKANLLARTS